MRPRVSEFGVADAEVMHSSLGPMYRGRVVVSVGPGTRDEVEAAVAAVRVTLERSFSSAEPEDDGS